MKKTSRRSFSKAMGASLASLSLTSLASAREEDDSDRDPKTVSGSQRLLSDRNQHDTPPPLMITQGSLVVEIDKPMAFLVTANGRKKYRRPKNTHDANLDHIKIVDGSGEMLYRNDKPRDCEIVVTLSGGAAAELKVGGGAELVVEIPESMDIGTSEHSDTSRRHEKYRPSSAQITAIRVQRGASVIYSVSRDEVVSGLEDVRIMVWHDDH
jgi:hypothetical protein